MLGQPALTKEQIERASRREGSQYPVISVIEYHGPRIAQHNEEFNKIEDNKEQQRYAARNFGFLGDAFEEADDFPLAPLDLVAVWSKAMEVWPDNCYPRYGLARMLSSAYGIQGRPDLRGLSRYFLETGKLPDGLARDKSGLVYVKSRLDHVNTSLKELKFYVSGTKESAVALAVKLTARIRDGDEQAGVQLKELIGSCRERSTPVLEALQENFGTGILSVYLKLNDALGKLG